MRLIPSDNWFWYYDQKLDRVMLDLSNGMVFCSRYSSRDIIPDAYKQSPFTVEDASCFYLYQEVIQRLNFNEASSAELALNALVAKHYLKPLMPKSWYFKSQPSIIAITVASCVQVKLIDSEKSHRLFVVDAGEQASLCLLLEPSMALGEKHMQFAQAIKIMNDRFIAMPHEVTSMMVPVAHYKVS